MHSTTTTACLFAALLAIPALAEPSRESLSPAFPAGQASAVTGTLRFVTYNIENFSDGVNDKDRPPEAALAHAKDAAAVIARLDPDILVLQEIENAAALALLNGALPRPYPLGFVTDFRSPSGRTGPHNVAVLSRIPLRDVLERDFGSLTGDVVPTRGFLRVVADLPDGRPLVIYSTHLKSNYGQKARNHAQRKMAMEAIRTDADEFLRGAGNGVAEILLAGDMNTDPDSAEFANDPTLDAIKGWVDLWRGRPLAERGTCPTRRGDPTREFPPAAFDRVIVSPALTSQPWVVSQPRMLPEGVNTKDVYALPGTGRGHVSDHYPVAVDLKP